MLPLAHKNIHIIWVDSVLPFLLFSSLRLIEPTLSLLRSEVSVRPLLTLFCLPFSSNRSLFLKMTCSLLTLEAIEKSVVPWVNDQDVPFCPDCGNKFSIRNRRHHCRLCGSIMCKKCMELISLPLASRYRGGSPDLHLCTGACL